MAGSNITQTSIQDQFRDRQLGQVSLRKIIFALVLALLVHCIFLLSPMPSFLFKQKPPISIDQIDTKALEKIKRQWKEQEKALLLSKDKSAPTPLPPPKDARYFSDRNRDLERETRARQTNVIPTPPQVKSETIDKKESSLNKPGKLGNLGIPLNLGKKSQSKSSKSSTPTNEQGGDQALLDKNVPLGNENILKTQESVFYSFYSRIYEEIGPLWQSIIRSIPHNTQIKAGEYLTSVEIILDSNGRLEEIRMLSRSGFDPFDLAVQEAWKKMARFPNPPKGILKEDGKVHMGWTFAVEVGGSNFQWQYMPPAQNY